MLHSDLFRNSDSLRNLLAYLGEKSLKEPAEEVKEYTIGIEVCGKPVNYDPQHDASVRVQVSRLRQKLADYYSKEGAGDPVVLDLPKGRFTLVFRNRDSDGVEQSRFGARLSGALRRAKSMSRLTLVLLVLLAAALIWVGILSQRLREFSSQTATTREFSPFWDPFFCRVPTTVVFGSPPFFASSKHHLLLRLFQLTNPDDPRSSPEFATVDQSVGPLAGPRFDYATMGDAVAVQRLTAFFSSAGVPLRALPAHLAAWESIKDSNLVFIGAWRTHPLLRHVPFKHDFELGPDDQIHNLNPRPGEQTVYTTPSHRSKMTYTVVGAFPGLSAGHDMVIVTAHSSAGGIGAVDFITSRESMKIIKERVGLTSGGPRKYFQMLLRIYVDNDTPVRTEYLTHHLSP